MKSPRLVERSGINVLRIIVGYPEGKSPLGIRRGRWDKILKLILQK